MSDQNVEVARRAIVAWNAGDMDRLRKLYHPDAVMRYAVSDWPESGPFHGRDAIMRQFSWLRDTWDADSLDLVGDPLAAGNRVVVRAIWRAAGRGPDTDMELAWVYIVRRGLIVSAEFFQDHAEALEAARAPKPAGD
jgi:ketosteroid isomerase-like protein